jgi:P-type Ca2+ transporter type 2C
VASQELVRGDIVLLAEGDRLACDATLIRAESLSVDESLLTGESAPVLKQADGLQQVHAGTLVVQGQGVGRVSQIGVRTALGRIGASLRDIAPRRSRIQDELQRVVRWVAVYAVLASLVVAALSAARHGNWTGGLLAGLTLAMALIPEEFAVVWSVMMALGAWRLAQRRVLTRQPQAIETLGTASVLAVDKTGTLTINRMVLRALATAEASGEVSDGVAIAPALAGLLDAAADAAGTDGIEPMDRAIHDAHKSQRLHAQAGASLLHRTGVAPQRLYVSHWWRDASGAGRVVVKGAPEAVAALCGLAAQEAMQAERLATAMTRQGLRVLAVAQGRCDTTPLPLPPAAMPPLRWLGLIGFVDPLRAEVPAAIAQCRAAGIRVVMITGDAPLTALAIAREAGLVAANDGEPDLLTGAQVAALDDTALQARIAGVAICARVAPQQKLRIVRALQAGGHVVAMTGDGVNDAPALRAADIGVAMGARGTDVAREAASLVLQDDSFASLVEGVRGGRRIFINLKKSVGYLLAVHVPIVGVALLPLLIGGPPLLLPLHVVFLELLIDPACSLVFEAEPEPADCMRVPPRSAQSGLMSWPMLRRALVVGALALLFVGAVQGWARMAGWSEAWSRAAALGSLIITNVAMLAWFRHGTRPWRQTHGNRVFVALLAALAAACGVVLAWQPLLRQFGLPIEPRLQTLGWWFVALGMATAVLAWRKKHEPARLL